jgi:hypothetical protein
MGDYGDDLRNGWANGTVPIYTPNVTFEEVAAFCVRAKRPMVPQLSYAPPGGIDRGILLVCDPKAAKFLGTKITHVAPVAAARKGQAA